MAQWTFVDPNTLLPGDPWTSAKAQAAFENLEAVAEGAPGAPPVNFLFRKIASVENPAFGPSQIVITDIDPHLGVFVWTNTTAGSTRNITFSVSSDNGATWTSIAASANINSAAVISFGSGPRSSRLEVGGGDVSSESGGILVNAVRLSALGGDGIGPGAIEVYSIVKDWIRT